MLGRESGQTGFFQLESLGSLMDRIVPPDSFHGRMARERKHLFTDDDFAALYSLDRGRPSVPPSQLAALMLLQAQAGVSDVQAIDRMTADLRWKYALGLAVDEVLCTRVSLVHFRARLHLHDEGERIFNRIVERAQELKVLKRRGARAKVVLDTTPIFGRGAVEDTYNLLATGIEKLVKVLARVARRKPAAWAREHGLGGYFGSSIKGEAAVDWSDAKARRAFLAGIVADGDRLLETARSIREGVEAGSAADKAILEAAELLVSLLQQDVERRDDGPALREGVAKDRIVSVNDPDMRHGHKSKSTLFHGHKAAIAVEPESGIVTAVDVLPGNAPDSDGALEMIEATEAVTGLEVEETIGDCAYGDAATRQEFKNAGRRLVAKVPGPSSNGLFAKERFEIDLAAGTCTCPAGEVTDRLVRRRNMVDRKGHAHLVRQFNFPAEVCQACPLRSLCTRAKQGGRTIAVHPMEAELAAARAWQNSPEFDRYRRLRQVVEHRIARLVQLEVRQSRFFGRRKTRFQWLMAAAAANLTLVWSHGERSGRRPAVLGPFQTTAARSAWSQRSRASWALHGLSCAVATQRLAPQYLLPTRLAS